MANGANEGVNYANKCANKYANNGWHRLLVSCCLLRRLHSRYSHVRQNIKKRESSVSEVCEGDRGGGYSVTLKQNSNSSHSAENE